MTGSRRQLQAALRVVRGQHARECPMCSCAGGSQGRKGAGTHNHKERWAAALLKIFDTHGIDVFVDGVTSLTSRQSLGTSSMLAACA